VSYVCSMGFSGTGYGGLNGVTAIFVP